MIWLLACTGCNISSNLEEGREALGRGDLLGAEAAWREVLTADPTHAEGLYGLGWTWHLAGQEEEAREVFERCVDLHPTYAPCFRGLGSVAMAQGNTAMAKKRFLEAQTHAPGDVSIAHSLGLLELARGDAAASLAIFDTLLQADPSRSEYHQARAEALLSLKEHEKAVESAVKAIELAQDNRTRALAYLTHSRALVNLTANRVDPSACEKTAAPIYAVLEEADKDLDRALSLGIPVPELLDARRMIQRRRGAIDDICPGIRVGREFPGE